MSVKLQISLASAAPNFGDAKAEFQALASACGFCDLSARSKLAVTGKDRVRWLNGMVSNNIRDLQPGSGVYCFVLNPQGRIQGDLYVYHRGDYLLLDIEITQAEKVVELLQGHIIMDDVTIADISAKLNGLALAGPKIASVLKAALGSLPELQPLQFADLNWKDVGLTLVRKDSAAVPSYELWLSPENVAPVWDAVAKAGAKPVGTQAIEWLRISCGVPRYGADIRDRDLPQETGQMRALSFTKGCYIGQEIVERIRSRGNVHRTFAGFRVEGALPEPGTKILNGEKEIGEITSAASLPAAGREQPVALGYIRREAVDANSPLQAGSAKLAAADFPFIQFPQQ